MARKPSKATLRARARKAAETRRAKAIEAERKRMARVVAARRAAVTKRNRARVSEMREAGRAARIREEEARKRKNDRARQRYHKRKALEKLHVARVEILGEVTLEGGGLHGADRADWFVLRAKIRERSTDWIEFLTTSQALGLSYAEATNEWFSPKL